MSTSSLAHLAELPDSTRKVLEVLASAPDIARYILVGGTGLALYTGHRISEDVDLAYVQARQLPRESIKRLIAYMEQAGFESRFATSDAAIIDFSENSALDLLDYQQDWLVGEVKLTFFTPDEPAIFDAGVRDRIVSLPVATREEIFDSKALLFAELCRARDMVDLWWLIEKEGIPIERMEQAYLKAGQPDNLKTAIARIRAQSYKASDPGYEPLVSGLPDKDGARTLMIEKLEGWLIQKVKQAQS